MPVTNADSKRIIETKTNVRTATRIHKLHCGMPSKASDSIKIVTAGSHGSLCARLGDNDTKQNVQLHKLVVRLADATQSDVAKHTKHNAIDRFKNVLAIYTQPACAREKKTADFKGDRTSIIKILHVRAVESTDNRSVCRRCYAVIRAQVQKTITVAGRA